MTFLSYMPSKAIKLVAGNEILTGDCNHNFNLHMRKVLSMENQKQTKNLADELKEPELVAQAKPREISTRDPITLKPHQVSAALYIDIEPYREMRGWRADSVPSPELARQVVIDKTATTDLLKSIGRDGIILNPLIINEHDIIISGNRRWVAALQLGLTSVPVEVKSFANEVKEKRAILDYNLYRQKTFSQRMREAELLREIAGGRAKQKMLAGRRDPTLILEEGSGKRHSRETAAIVGTQVRLGRDTLRKAQEIWSKAKEGDQKAAELIGALDRNGTSVNAAYNTLKKRQKPSRWQKLEPVDSGEVLACPHCKRPCRLLHVSDGNNRHRLMP